MSTTKVTDSVRDTTAVDAAKITTGTIPEARITTLDATKLTGNIANARIPASAVTQHVTAADLTPAHQGIANLGLIMATEHDKVAFNLTNSFIDIFQDDTGITTETNVDRNASEYISTLTSSTTVTTPSSASDYTGSTGSATIGSGTVEWDVNDKSMRSTNSVSGDFEFTGRLTAGDGQGGWLGAFPVSEVGSFNSNHEAGTMTSAMTNSFFLAWTSRAGATNGTNKGGSVQTTFNPVTNDVFKLTRVAAEIKYYVNDVLKTTLTGQTTADMYFGIGGGGSAGTDYTGLSWSAAGTATSATGTAISTANTALTAPTTGDIVLLIENASGTATLNTDIKAYVSRNGGTGWDQATLVDKGSWGTNKKILVANNVAFSNSASGTDMRYKIEWANQASGSKVTRVHATSLAWA